MHLQLSLAEQWDQCGSSGNIGFFAAGGPAGTLPWIGDDHPICDTVAMLFPGYTALEAAARRRGLRRVRLGCSRLWA